METFFNVSLPLAKNGILASTVISFARCIGTFGTVLILAGGTYMKGRMLQFGSMTSVFSRPQSRFIADFVGAGYFSGTVVSRDNSSSTIGLGGMRLTSLDRVGNGTTVDVAIRFENIGISRSRPLHPNGFNVTACTHSSRRSMSGSWNPII